MSAHLREKKVCQIKDPSKCPYLTFIKDIFSSSESEAIYLQLDLSFRTCESFQNELNFYDRIDN